MKYYFGCDNAAVELKNILKEEVVKAGFEVEDFGVDSSDDPTMYPDVAAKVCKKIQENNFQDRGVLVCGTGLGMAMVANKFKGIRAGVCHDNFSAERLSLSNDGNVICFGARIIGPELAKKILREFLDLKFIDGRSTPKVARIKEIESEMK